MKSSISSWRSERRQPTLCRLRPTLTLLTRLGRPVAPRRRPNGRKTPSLPCRLFSENFGPSGGRLKVFAPNGSTPNSPSISSPAGSGGGGVAADLRRLLVVALTHRGPTCLPRTVVLRFALHGCINLLSWDVLTHSQTLHQRKTIRVVWCGLKTWFIPARSIESVRKHTVRIPQSADCLFMHLFFLNGLFRTSAVVMMSIFISTKTPVKSHAFNTDPICRKH